MKWVEKVRTEHPVLFWTAIAIILAAYVVVWISVGEG